MRLDLGAVIYLCGFFILSYFFGPFRLQIGNAPICGGSFSLVKMTLRDFFFPLTNCQPELIFLSVNLLKPLQIELRFSLMKNSEILSSLRF